MTEPLSPEPISQDEQLTIDALLHYVGKGGTLKALQDIPEDVIEALYSQAYTFFQANKFEQALDVFKLLGLMDHYDVRFPMGSGLCQQRIGNHERAVEFFAAAGVLDVRNPEPPFCVGESLIQLKKLEDAKVSLVSAIQLAGNRTEHTSLKKRAQQLLELLSTGASS